MLSRKLHQEGKEFPKEWIGQISDLLNNLYASFCHREEKKFTIHGVIYSDELLLIVCLSKEDSLDTLPLSVFISVGYKNEGRQILDGVLDFLGILLENTLDKVESGSHTEDIYSVNWQEHKYHSRTYYYKITREDIKATLEANRLLNE